MGKVKPHMDWYSDSKLALEVITMRAHKLRGGKDIVNYPIKSPKVQRFFSEYMQ